MKSGVYNLFLNKKEMNKCFSKILFFKSTVNKTFSRNSQLLFYLPTNSVCHLNLAQYFKLCQVTYLLVTYARVIYHLVSIYLGHIPEQ